MRITIISPFSFGYVDTLVLKLKEYSTVDLLYYNINDFNYSYDSKFARVKNFWLKSFSNRNLKKEYVTREIKHKLEKQPEQDIILVIRPDKLETELLEWIKSYTGSLRTFYYDGTRSIPEQIDLIPYFDKIYSYDKKDVEKYGFEFITNFIPNDEEVERSGKGVFNISSHDNRFSTLEKIALQLKNLNFPYNIIVRKEKYFPSESIQVVQEYIPLGDVNSLMENASILLDVQKQNQQGLSFRVFEALGYSKKLITTNKDISNYDFYDPENILIIDGEEPIISGDFLDKPFVPIPEKIIAQYRREAWIKKVFGLSKAPRYQKVSIDL